MSAIRGAASSHSVIIVEPNAVLGESLKHYLEHKGLTVAGVADSARAVASLYDAAGCSTILLNGARGQIAADFALLKALRSNARIIVYGGPSDLKTTVAAIQSGAAVYLDDKVNALMLLKSLELAANGFVTLSITMRGEAIEPGAGYCDDPEDEAQSAVVPPPPAPATAPASRALPQVVPAARMVMVPVAGGPRPSFSPREASILQLLREGAPNKLIARQLSLTEATVKVHLKSILRKIRVNNRTQAAVWAMEQDALPGARDEVAGSVGRPVRDCV